ncbi:Smr/MutS family protein [Faunimonas sp. B44]|uniref:Smr/MutS family protein n=1 Tax=Faunimonas sp. B44 TaxID=3461493 RepID=UPI004044415F
MIRRLSDEEKALWAQVRHSVRPLRAEPRKGTREAEQVPDLQPAEAAPERANVPDARAPRGPATPPPKPSAPILAPLEARTRRRLASGRTPVDARLDLHGLTQAAAFDRLAGFLKVAQADGKRLVLVITGKGDGEDADRGVLRRTVPHWLARHELRTLIVGFEQAARRHGGAGALYVWLRRPR